MLFKKVFEITLLTIIFYAASIFAMTFLLMGFQIRIAFIVTFTVAMIITDIMGMMYLWNIPLNAVSLVNLVMVSDYLLCLSHSWFIRIP